MFTFLKNWTLPVAIAVGTVCYLLFAFTPSLDAAGDALLPVFETLLPLTIFMTLFVTFSKVDFHRMRLHRWQAVVLLLQLLLVVIFMGLILQLTSQKLLLEAVLICIIAPCASASPVVTAKLGGDLTQMTTFVLLSSLVASVLIPAVFPVLEPHEGLTFLSAFLVILRRLATVLLLPLLLGAIVRHWVKPLYDWFLRTPDLGFYLWSVSLSITAGITVRNILHSRASLALLLAIAFFTLLTAIVQFRLGRAVGRAYGEHICTGQAMFQKNTGLAIWIAYVYLTPIASIGAGCYVLWQNIINSLELWQHRKKTACPHPHL
ncbi:MAG: transporter [Bacteroidaceae bacterium]|nr:transporter [Bacteroidaceae bacterium]